MPSLSELPGEIKRRKFIKALSRLGFFIDKKGGNGSHFKIIWKNQKSVTIPKRLEKDVLYYILQEIENIGGITWDQIKNKL